MTSDATAPRSQAFKGRRGRSVCRPLPRCQGSDLWRRAEGAWRSFLVEGLPAPRQQLDALQESKTSPISACEIWPDVQRPGLPLTRWKTSPRSRVRDPTPRPRPTTPCTSSPPHSFRPSTLFLPTVPPLPCVRTASPLPCSASSPPHTAHPATSPHCTLHLRPPPLPGHGFRFVSPSQSLRS